MTEAQTRVQRIDHLLRKAQWNPNDKAQVRQELPVADLAAHTVGEAPADLYGITDY